MSRIIHAIFRSQCPNCNGDITDIRLKYKIPCKKCIPIDDEEIIQEISKLNINDVRRRIREYLKTYGTIKNYEEMLEIEEKVDEIEELFEEASGSKFWSAQRAWCKRALSGKSFAIIAPTGMGKTSFGIIFAIYLAKNNKKSFIILPTSLLTQQVQQRIEYYLERLGLKGVRVVAYHALMTERKRKEMLEKICENNFDILVTTSYFLSRNYEKMVENNFDMIFVDDVDSFVRTSKNVDRVLRLLGIPQREIDEAYRIINGGKGEQNKINNIGTKGKYGTLIVSGASIKARRTKRIKLIREILGFEIGGRIEGFRNIIDTYVKIGRNEDILDKMVKIVKELGNGGLIFIPIDKGAEYVKKVVEKLNENNIKAASATQAKKRLLERFRNREYDVLVGIASFRSPLTRGIDLPETVKYALFVGVPKIKISLEIMDFRPYKAIILLSNIRDHVKTDRERNIIDKQISEIRRFFTTIREEELMEIIEATKSNVKVEGYKGRLQQILQKTIKIVRDMLSNREIRSSIIKSPYLEIEDDEKLTITVPDIVAFLQASGRTSRLYAGGVSKGLTVTIVDSEKAFNGLLRGIKWYIEDAEFKKYHKKEINRIIREINEERDKIKKIRQGEISGEVKEIVKTALLIVESPHKATTIARFFGTPQRRIIDELTVLEVSTGNYILNIASTAGHLFDLTVEDGYYGVIEEDDKLIPIYDTIRRCRKCNRNVTEAGEICNICKSKLENKKTIIEALKKVAKEVDVLIIATDDDSEGEKIGWDIAQVLSPYVREIKRIRFHEVTTRALREALQKLGEIDTKMVEAQLVRRIEDRWIGFELSKKVQEEFGKKDLSAGRVQTPVLGWIVESIQELKRNVVDVLEVTLQNDRKILMTTDKMRRRELDKIIKDIESSEVEVLDVNIKEEELKPKPPYTTDALLRDSSERLGLSASETMRVAQDLFEWGLITYHRTSSTRVSALGMKIAADYISEKWGPSEYAPRSWGEEGAHECIRPTRPIDVNRLRYLVLTGIIRLSGRLTEDHYDLYNLIFTRFIASQMKTAKVLREKATLRILDNTLTVEEDVEVLEWGFTLISPIRTVQRLDVGRIKVKSVRSWRKSLKPLFTEGSLVMKMRERSIGRPSTYAHIISTLIDRRYVKKTSKRGKLIATSLGAKVYGYLISKYNQYVCEETTRRLEKLMDDVEEGEVNYIDVLRELYEEMKTLSVTS